MGERRAFPVGPYMFLRQTTEVNGKLSFVFYVKVSNDPGSKPIPVQSRDYTALAGMDNTPDNLGRPYPCTGKDLDYPKARDTWLDTNKEAMEDQKKQVAVAFAQVCEKGFEVGGTSTGGALNAQQLEKYGDNFKDGMHKPTFHEDGLHGPMEAGGKTYESGFHYLLECHELGGKNANGGYGGPLCEDPYGAEVQALVDQILKESEDDRTLCYNNFHDPCPMLTKEQVALCKGFDYGDKTLKLPCGPLPWPAGLPEPGYVPKTNPPMGAGLQSLAARPLSLRRPSRQECSVPQRPIRSRLTPITNRLAVCSCASTSSVTSALWTPLSPSTLAPNEPGAPATTSTSRWSRAATSWASGCCPKNIARSASSTRWTQAGASASSAAHSLEENTPSCVSPQK